MYTSTQLIPPSKTLLEGENNMRSGVSHVREATCFFKNFSLDSKSDCARPLTVTNESPGIQFAEFEFLDVKMCLFVMHKV